MSSEQTRVTRRRITIARIENESNRQVTFSKRRAGLFKKAHELCTLTVADASVVVFSPGNKSHSFGHPSVHAIADRYLNSQNTNASDAPNEGMATTHQMELDYLAEIEKMIKIEKERGKELIRTQKSLMLPDIQSLDHKQLDQFKGSVVDFQKKFEMQMRISSQSYQDIGGPSDPGIDQGPSRVGDFDGNGGDRDSKLNEML